jgi:hypothetical protein
VVAVDVLTDQAKDVAVDLVVVVHDLHLSDLALASHHLVVGAEAVLVAAMVATERCMMQPVRIVETHARCHSDQTERSQSSVITASLQRRAQIHLVSHLSDVMIAATTVVTTDHDSMQHLVR